jgi:sulfur-oxidizing protein SoxY
MVENNATISLTRRALLTATCVGGASLVSLPSALAIDDGVKLIQQLTGKIPTESDRVHLAMPPVFPNGYSVPLALDIDSPMTETDYVRYVRVLAPRNPIIDVATFYFPPRRSEPRVSTRIRIAEPQYIVAVAEMNDGALLTAKAWVEVATNGCI